MSRFPDPPVESRLHSQLYFYTFGNMKHQDIVRALAALAQDSRLAVFRLLVKRGPEGYSAGEIGEKLDIPGPTLSFHLKELTLAGLILLTGIAIASLTFPTRYGCDDGTGVPATGLCEGAGLRDGPWAARLAFSVSTDVGERANLDGTDCNGCSAPAGSVVAVPHPAIAKTAANRAAAIVEVVTRRRVEDIAGNATRSIFGVAERLLSVSRTHPGGRPAASGARGPLWPASPCAGRTQLQVDIWRRRGTIESGPLNFGGRNLVYVA